MSRVIKGKKKADGTHFPSSFASSLRATGSEKMLKKMILLGMLSVLVACNMYLVNLISEDGSKVRKRRSLLVSLLLSLKLRRKSSPARPYRKILLMETQKVSLNPSFGLLYRRFSIRRV